MLDGPPEVLLEAAEAEHADLLVVGNRGAGGLAGLHVGSVAHHLAHHTGRPLAIVPSPTAHDHPGTIVAPTHFAEPFGEVRRTGGAWAWTAV